jgi:drug/metabolite transporter (DMT)-like permease
LNGIFLKIALEKSFKGALWIVGWAISFSGTMIFNKLMPQNLPTFLVLAVRSALILSVMIPILWIRKGSVFTSKNKKWHFIRGLIISGAMLCSYSAYRHLPAETAAFLGTSGPFFILIFSRIFLKEHFSRLQGIFMCLGYAGVLMIMLPFSFKGGLYLLLPIVGNILVAGGVVCSRILAINQESTENTLFYASLIPFVLFSVGSAGAVPEITWTAGWFFLAIGICAGVSQLCYYQAIKATNASFVASLEFLRLFFFIPLSWLFFQEVVKTKVWVGGVLIVIASILATLAKANSFKK